MVNQVEEESLSLIEYVGALEGKDSVARGKQVQSFLESEGIEFKLQECHRPHIRNIIIDFSSSPEEKRLIFSAHYDVVKGCPGANDNASGVAVLLGLCRELKQRRASIRVIFFDREEAWFRTPVVKLGLLGSLYYVLKNDLRNISAVYNLEFCGLGEFLAIWPVKRHKKILPACKEAEKAAAKLGLNSKSAYIPWLLLSSDHLSFRIKGVSNAITLSFLPVTQLPALENLISNLSIQRLLIGQRPILPGILSSVHTTLDTTSLLSENSLRLMLSLILEIVENFNS